MSFKSEISVFNKVKVLPYQVFKFRDQMYCFDHYGSLFFKEGRWCSFGRDYTELCSIYDQHLEDEIVRLYEFAIDNVSFFYFWDGYEHKDGKIFIPCINRSISFAGSNKVFYVMSDGELSPAVGCDPTMILAITTRCEELGIVIGKDDTPKDPEPNDPPVTAKKIIVKITETYTYDNEEEALEAIQFLTKTHMNPNETIEISVN